MLPKYYTGPEIYICTFVTTGWHGSSKRTGWCKNYLDPSI